MKAARPGPDERASRPVPQPRPSTSSSAAGCPRGPRRRPDFGATVMKSVAGRLRRRPGIKGQPGTGRHALGGHRRPAWRKEAASCRASSQIQPATDGHHALPVFRGRGRARRERGQPSAAPAGAGTPRLARAAAARAKAAGGQHARYAAAKADPPRRARLQIRPRLPPVRLETDRHGDGPMAGRKRSAGYREMDNAGFGKDVKSIAGLERRASDLAKGVGREFANEHRPL